MFHLYQPDYIEWPVSVDLPAKGGVKKPYKFTAHFKMLDEAECRDLQDRHNEMIVALRRRVDALNGYLKDDSVITEPLPCTHEELVDEILCGWGDEVVDNDGEPVPFSDAAKAKLYRIQGVAQAIFRSWMDSLGTPSEKSAKKAGGFREKN